MTRLEPGDVVRIKPDVDSKRWTKATVEKEVDIRSYKVRTEDGHTYTRNRRHLGLTREPFIEAPFPELSTNLQHRQPVTVAKLPRSPLPVPPDVEIPEGPTVVQPVPESDQVSPLPSVVTTRSGQVITSSSLESPRGLNARTRRLWGNKI